MGYILPIQSFQYTDYQSRLNKPTNSIPTVEKPYKVVFESQYEDVKEEPKQASGAFPKYYQQKLFEEARGKDSFPLFTGKGYYINEHV
ncbi:MULTISPECIES: hypothetical protein [unclassified Virgibacillus]|uniref:hypothetical protein n=1 Tax=unclassified Virgibacillus TaxID=2620237 RepID=UPI0024DEAFCE|nr:hypothetical protein [Virgibacillus sp. LDC-1]